MKHQQLMVVDDEPDIARFVATVAATLGFETDVAFSVHEYREKCAAFAPDVVVTDIVMPKVDGFEFLQELATTQSPPKVFLMSGYTNKPYMKMAGTIGAVGGLDIVAEIPKPIRTRELSSILSLALVAA